MGWALVKTMLEELIADWEVEWAHPRVEEAIADKEVEVVWDVINFENDCLMNKLIG